MAVVTSAGTPPVGRGGMSTARAAGRTVLLVLLESRPQVQLAFQLRYAAAVAITVLVAPLHWTGALLGALAVFGSTVAVYALNGATDVVEDTENGSSRPVASGRLSPGTAVRGAAVAASGALLAAAWLGWVPLLLVVLLLGLGAAYSAGPRPWKRTMPGFLAAALGAGLLVYALGATAGAGAATPVITLELVLFAAAMSAWMGFGGATKDLSDVAGDRLAGRRTWPVLLGERRARRVIAACVVAVGGAFATLVVTTGADLLPAAAVFTAGALVLGAVLLGARGEGAARLPYRLFMTTQCTTNVVGVAGCCLAG